MGPARSRLRGRLHGRMGGQEERILRHVLGHGLPPTLLVAGIVLFYAYVAPGWVPHGTRLWF